MNAIPDQPCAHAPCGCKVDHAGDCCSDSCRQQQGSQVDHACQCGHSDCVVAEALQRAEQH
ncbi:hypothetical protein [Rhodanobacter ginsengiterrae]|uniref:hypothetical protein n=1 Tax=Rhodanobacter ginsengiterrae TaxID=2008451 RepID=UPI003CF474FA